MVMQMHSFQKFNHFTENVFSVTMKSIVSVCAVEASSFHITFVKVDQD